MTVLGASRALSGPNAATVTVLRFSVRPGTIEVEDLGAREEPLVSGPSTTWNEPRVEISSGWLDDTEDPWDAVESTARLRGSRPEPEAWLISCDRSFGRTAEPADHAARLLGRATDMLDKAQCM